jgi:hypothetical protein
VRGEGPCHGRVVPEQVTGDTFTTQKVVEQHPLLATHVLHRGPARQVRRHDPHGIVTFNLQSWKDSGFEDGLFDEEDPALLGASRHQMLRPLEHESPTQVRQADEVWTR